MCARHRPQRRDASTDGAANWTTPTTLRASHVSAVLADNKDAHTLYVGVVNDASTAACSIPMMPHNMVAEGFRPRRKGRVRALSRLRRTLRAGTNTACIRLSQRGEWHAMNVV